MTVADAIRFQNRVRELNKMRKGELDALRRRLLAARNTRIIYEAGASKDELIHEILVLEGLA